MVRSYHGQVDIGGIELHVDLLVDHGLAVLVVVLPDPGDHLCALGVDPLEEIGLDWLWECKCRLASQQRSFIDPT